MSYYFLTAPVGSHCAEERLILFPMATFRFHVAASSRVGCNAGAMRENAEDLGNMRENAGIRYGVLIGAIFLSRSMNCFGESSEGEGETHAVVCGTLNFSASTPVE